MNFDNNDPFGAFNAQTPGAPTQTAPQSQPQSVPKAAGSGSPFPTNSGGGGGDQQQQQQKYQILNMFWLINPKAYSNEEMKAGEANFASISYNVNFGNLRIELCNMTQDSIVNQMICLNKINRLLSATIYPAAMFQVVSNVPEVFCMEQIINYNNADWQNNLKGAKFNTSETGVILTIAEHCYEFTGWQKEALLYSCKFGLNQGLVLSGENLRNK
jgi:hypothetical protein